jgi:hypothetical protein
MASQTYLLEIVGTLSASRGLASRLYRRQKQCDQNANDRNDHKQLNQGKTV